jgi:hypothetical protein
MREAGLPQLVLPSGHDAATAVAAVKRAMPKLKYIAIAEPLCQAQNALQELYQGQRAPAFAMAARGWLRNGAPRRLT